MAYINEYFEIKKFIDRNRKNFILKESFEEIKENYHMPEQVENMTDEKDFLFLEQYKDELLTKKEYERLSKKYLLPYELKCLPGERVQLEDYISALRFVRNKDNLVKNSDIESGEEFEDLKRLKLKDYDKAIEHVRWYRKKNKVWLLILVCLLIVSSIIAVLNIDKMFMLK